MNKRIKIAVIITLVIVLVLIAFLIFKKNTSITTSPSGSLNAQLPSAQFVVPEENSDKMTIPTKSGSVEINNVYKNPAENLSDNGVSFKNNVDYYMAFYPKDKYFLISVLNSDIEATRIAAENDFLQTLGITEDQACLLNVSLYVPSFVNERNSGQDFGLSFCPNGKPFGQK